MVKNIIFDLGNVLIGYDPLEYLENKINDSEKIDKLYDVIFRGKEWTMLDEGSITENKAIETICKANPELDKEIRICFDNWYPLLKPIESTIDVLGELKCKGYKLFFLSNFHDKAFSYVSEEYPFFKLFDGGVVSYREKVIKPNSEIYKILLEGYNLRAEECVFIDDTEENIKAGEVLGIRGIHLKNTAHLREELKEYIL